MKIIDFRTIFFGELNKVMLPIGFRFVKSKQSYMLKYRNGWEIEIIVDCIKGSSDIHVQTKIYATNSLLLKKEVETIVGKKYHELIFGGVFPFIFKILELEGTPPSQWLIIETKDEVVSISQTWCNDFNRIALPFINKISEGIAFAIEIMNRFPESFYFPLYTIYFPLLLKTNGADKESMKILYSNMEQKKK